MKIRFILGFLLALSIGVSVGYSLKASSYYLYAWASGVVQDNFRQVQSMGGPGLDYTEKELDESELENFPNNSSDLTLPNLNQEDFQVPNEGKAILADLDLMILKTYENGVLVDTYNILGKGRQGTAWETPPGKFDILYKTQNHFSSIGAVWMPYSMQFFGNYFIHGWPYYADGTPVEAGYSGGCIRMDNQDMKEIYEFSGVGTTVIVKGSLPADQEDQETGIYQDIKVSNFPNISSDGFLVADIDSGQVIKADSHKVKYPIASITKLMTALVSLETLNQYRDTKVSHRAYATYGQSGNLQPGEIYPIGELLYPLMLTSSNDAAEVIAEANDRNFFMQNMNSKALSIGLKNTTFDDPSGLSQDNISTAEDIFRLTQYIYKYKNFILEVSKTKDRKFANKNWLSHSRFRNDDNYLGGKNGFTDEARHTLVSIFKLPLGEYPNGEPMYRNIAIVLLQGEKTEKDTRDINLWLLNNIFFEKL